MRTSGNLQTLLFAGTAMLWLGYATLLLRQKHLFEQADPLKDTGLSFGYAALVRLGMPAMILYTLVAFIIAYLMLRSSRRSAFSLKRNIE